MVLQCRHVDGAVRLTLWGGILCRECDAEYTKDFNERHLPDPLKGLTRSQLIYAFEPENWAHIRKIEFQMSQEGKSQEEIRAAVFAYAEECKRHGLQVMENIARQMRQKEQQQDFRNRYSY